MRLPQRTKAETKRNKRNQTVRVIPSGFKLSEESRIFLFCGRTSTGGVAVTLPTELASFVSLLHFPRFIGEIYSRGESENLYSEARTKIFKNR